METTTQATAEVPADAGAEQRPRAGSDAGGDAATDLVAEDEHSDRDPSGAYGDLEPEQQPLFDIEGRIRLSYSRVDTYRTCPAQFRYRYVDGLPTLPSPHLSLGSSIHTALERFYGEKLPHAPSVDDLLSYLYDAWDTTGFRQMSRDEQLRWYRHAQDILRRFHARHAPQYRLPADVEKWFEVPFDDVAMVVGSIDRVDVDDDGNFEVVDYKTSKRVRDRDAVRNSLQLAIYALACRHLYGRLPAAVSLNFVVPAVEIRVPIDEIDLERAHEEVIRVAKAVRSEMFTPSPNRLCDWCDFRSLCPAWDGDGPEVLGPAMEKLRRLRRQVRRGIRDLRQLEAGVDQLTAEAIEAMDAERKS